MTRAELEAYPKNFLTPAVAAQVTGQDPHTIRLLARERPHLLGYPVMVSGTRTRIPKQPFIEAWFGTQKEAHQC